MWNDLEVFEKKLVESVLPKPSIRDGASSHIPHPTIIIASSFPMPQIHACGIRQALYVVCSPSPRPEVSIFVRGSRLRTDRLQVVGGLRSNRAAGLRHMVASIRALCLPCAVARYLRASRLRLKNAVVEMWRRLYSDMRNLI